MIYGFDRWTISYPTPVSILVSLLLLCQIIQVNHLIAVFGTYREVAHNGRDCGRVPHFMAPRRERKEKEIRPLHHHQENVPSDLKSLIRPQLFKLLPLSNSPKLRIMFLPHKPLGQQSRSSV